MKTDDFNFDLPEELIAQKPAERRTDARMMVLHRDTGKIEHRRVHNITEYLNGPDLLVMNNTKVIPARIFGEKADTGGKVELLLLEEIEPSVWLCLMKTSRRPKPGAHMNFCNGELDIEMLEDGEQGRCLLRFSSERPLLELLDESGVPPLPPYIARKTRSEDQLTRDKERYQTVFAEVPGAVAAPTAGLHFSDDLLAQLRGQGVNQSMLTLHVGIGTFRPVDAEIITDHKMDEERYLVSTDSLEQIKQSKDKGGRTVAVGSTSVRTLETVAGEFKKQSEAGEFEALQGRTDIFIYPPYDFKMVDAIVTNFHLPKSTLLMMMSAFAGRDLMLKAYEEAIREGYRFYSYGDCMLIL
ncbi:tRNA preQ1(34) S-adenosylmethionine ribosyltransferase-isomerase QueA [Verrucomicrobiota bacterium]